MLVKGISVDLAERFEIPGFILLRFLHDFDFELATNGLFLAYGSGCLRHD